MGKTKSVPALERSLTILELLASSRSGLSLAEVSRHLGLARSSAHYLLLTLQRRGYLHRNSQTRRYMFALKLFSLSNMALNGLTIREQAVPFLRKLMESTRLTVHMGILEQNEAVLVEKVEPPGVFSLATWPGKRMPVHCTGIGKALISYLPEADLDRIIKRGLLRYNENTIVSAKKLKEQLARIRHVGYAVDDEEETIGLRCVGAPMLDSQEQPLASISVAGTIDQINSENLCSIAAKVRETALAISQQMQLDREKDREREER